MPTTRRGANAATDVASAGTAATAVWAMSTTPIAATATTTIAAGNHRAFRHPTHNYHYGDVHDYDYYDYGCDCGSVYDGNDDSCYCAYDG